MSDKNNNISSSQKRTDSCPPKMPCNTTKTKESSNKKNEK